MDAEHYKKLLQKAEKRLEQAEKGQQEERRRADEEHRRADEEHRRAADIAEEQIRLTTFDEYIAACHSLVYSRILVKAEPDLASKGSITNPPGKWCPQGLRPWPNFLELQRTVFGSIYDIFPIEERVFENRAFLAGLGGRLSLRPIKDEKTLEFFLHLSVEDPTRAIIEQLKMVQDARAAFEMGDGIIFENRPQALSEVADEVVNSETSAIASTSPPDQICVYRSNHTTLSQRTMIYISEHKPPHKLTAPHLRAGLRAMDIHKEVVNRKMIPTAADPDALFRYHAERLTASAITQTYHYMIEGGLDYGLLTTGEAIVFLNVDWVEPGTLYYHLAEPSHEVMPHPNHFHICTAVGQYLAFTLMALGRPGERRGHGQDERDRARAGLKSWNEDFEMTLRSIPESARSAPDSSSDYAPTTYSGIDRSPFISRRRTRPYAEDHPSKDVARREDRREPSDDESMSKPPPDTHTPAGRGARQTARRSQRLALQTRGEGSQQERQYCTQKCLLGMVNGGLLDSKCPNTSLHNKGSTEISPRYHPISHDEFLFFLQKQLKETLDNGITPIRLGGARGVLFQVTLLSHGYTFISKGTVRAFIKDLKHETAVYRRLRPIQGVYVPVFLGVIDLRTMDKIYYYDHRVYVVYMIFLSWGGCSINRIDAASVNSTQMEDAALRPLKAMHREGVIHRDVRLANMLFNPETGRAMMIDFERSTLLEAPHSPLAQSVLNKRMCRREASVVKATKKVCNVRARREEAFAEDISCAKIAFLERNGKRLGA
ncbi:Protein kinase-like domain protein [Metarhizium rileyi]|uniref:non-specific serine/threonine protein kinase n=1 Tax=Metarhizium rileyi (strain RCEF 4871) TaxID=1649241 RepID=A0A166VRR3_METRR|nr:Protein kinase-like domain protein [Metarhizium rileyi RCEF 4871]